VELYGPMTVLQTHGLAGDNQ